MTTLPIELANARKAVTEAWNEYQVIIDRDHTEDEWKLAHEKAVAAQAKASEWYCRWQAVGGTSDIESIEAAERFLNLVEVALTDADTIATALWQIEAEAQAADANDWMQQTNELRHG